MNKRSWLLANWLLSKDLSIHGSVLVRCDKVSIYYLYHSSINQLECFIFDNSEYSEIVPNITPGAALNPGDYTDYIEFNDIS